VITLTSELAPLYGPALRCKLDLNKCRVVLRFCSWPLHGAIVLLAIMHKGFALTIVQRATYVAERVP
jgi:hypothetical protein